jgi:hypothetical protein
MDLTHRVYLFSKQRQILEQKVKCFIKDLTDVQKFVQEAELIFLIQRAKRLLEQIEKCDKRIQTFFSNGNDVPTEVMQECLFINKMEKLYQDYSSEYNEVLQRLLEYKY